MVYLKEKTEAGRQSYKPQHDKDNPGNSRHGLPTTEMTHQDMYQSDDRNTNNNMPETAKPIVAVGDAPAAFQSTAGSTS